MSQHLRIAILECDTPIDTVKARYGTYGDRFKTLLEDIKSQFLDDRTSMNITVGKYNVTEGVYPALDAIDGILITGSKSDSFADTEWIRALVKFIRSAAEAEVRIVGVCFGHQIVARAMGAAVGRNPSGWEISVDAINLTEIGSVVFGKEVLFLHQMHRDEVLTVPEGFQNLGSSPRCGIQGLFKPNCSLSIQAHPEFDETIMQSILEKRHIDGVFAVEPFNDALARTKLPHDGLLVMEAFLRFFINRKDQPV